jgi:hypothetical protein
MVTLTINSQDRSVESWQRKGVPDLTGGQGVSDSENEEGEDEQEGEQVDWVLEYFVLKKCVLKYFLHFFNETPLFLFGWIKSSQTILSLSLGKYETVVYYESRKRDLKIRLMNEGRCDETLK